MFEEYRIYPENGVPRVGDLTTAPIFIFLVGTALAPKTYATVFQPLVQEQNIIVYVLDTDPGSIAKTLQGFQNRAGNILGNIRKFLKISTTSDNIYLGGHSVGGIIALNAVFPKNFGIDTSPLTVNALPFPVRGFIGFDPVDGDKGNNKEYAFSTKFDPSKATQYTTATGEVNPFPILIFATATENTSINPDYGGQRAYRLLANSLNNPINKYALVSADKYHHMDYTDPFNRAYKTDLSRLLWTETQQSNYIAGFQAFLRAKIISFIFDSTFDTTGFEDVQLHPN